MRQSSTQPTISLLQIPPPTSLIYFEPTVKNDSKICFYSFPKIVDFGEGWDGESLKRYTLARMRRL